MRKRLAILLALCMSVVMAYGVIGSGAQFLKTVTGQENINVGTFACLIDSASPTGAVIAGDKQSVTYTAATIVRSDAGSAPFAFTVKNTGSIPMDLTVATSALGDPFSVIGSPFAARPLAAGASTEFATGVQWGALTNDNLGASGTETWTVSCAEQPLVRHWSEGSNTAIGPVFKSTNTLNIASGDAHATLSNSTITFSTSHPYTDATGGSCLEYRFNLNVPDQRKQVVPATDPITYRANYNSGVTDGLYPFVCISSDVAPIGSATVAIPAGVTSVEVRSAFGAESNERFDWTRFNLLP